MTKGFLVLAQNSKTVNYVKQAYALALSIKMSQKEITNISLVTNDPVPKKYQKAFDQIIPIPFNDDAANSDWKIENRWKLVYASPYDETIALEADMLMLEDISEWWDYLKNYDLKFCSRVKNYKLEVIKDSMYRKTFQVNKLTDPYIALHYFKKSDLAFEFYKALEFIVNNWEYCWTQYAPQYYQKWLSMDLAAAVAIEMLDCQGQVIDPLGPLEFIHMKPGVQDWSPVPATWQDTVPWVLNTKGDLVVGNIKQSKLFHYVEKDFLTPTLMKRLEELAYGKKG